MKLLFCRDSALSRFSKHNQIQSLTQERLNRLIEKQKLTSAGFPGE
jgi:hypothetical protein